MSAAQRAVAAVSQLRTLRLQSFLVHRSTRPTGNRSTRRTRTTAGWCQALGRAALCRGAGKSRRGPPSGGAERGSGPCGAPGRKPANVGAVPLPLAAGLAGRHGCPAVPGAGSVVAEAAEGATRAGRTGSGRRGEGAGPAPDGVTSRLAACPVCLRSVAGPRWAEATAVGESAKQARNSVRTTRRSPLALRHERRKAFREAALVPRREGSPKPLA